MMFRLCYKGPLRSGETMDGATRRAHMHAIRQVFHAQMKALWDQKPLSDYTFLRLPPQPLSDLQKRQLPSSPPAMTLHRTVGSFTFVPLISDSVHLHGELDILFLRPSEPGQLVRHGGDLDNRIKLLLDAMRVPSKDQLPNGAQPVADEQPYFYCPFEDDALITRINIESDRLLKPDTNDEAEVLLIIQVSVRATRVTVDTMGLGH